MAGQAGADDRGSLLAVIGDEVDTLYARFLLHCHSVGSPRQPYYSQDTVTGFLLAGVGNVDLRRKSNFLVVTESKLAWDGLHDPISITSFGSPFWTH